MTMKRVVLLVVAVLGATALTVVLPVAQVPTSTDVASASIAPCLIDGTGCRVGSIGPGGGVVY